MAQQNFTVLVIDDEAPLRQTLVEALKETGLTVLEASHGKEGLETALAKKPALILSDNLMPVMTGVEMVTELRKDAWGKNVPVIIMTNVYNPEAVNTSLQAGTDYIMKSDLGIDKLIDLVQQRLGQKG